MMRTDMKKLLLLLLMIPTISFAEKYDSQYYKDFIGDECIRQSYMANNDFVAKKIFKRCEKAAKKCMDQYYKDEAKGDGIGYKYAFDRISLCLELKSSALIK